MVSSNGERNEVSIKDNDIWELVELPKGRKAVGSKWVFKAKTDPDGYVERFKACLVAQGFSQKFGLDCDETFCPVVRLESVGHSLHSLFNNICSCTKFM